MLLAQNAPAGSARAQMVARPWFHVAAQRKVLNFCCFAGGSPLHEAAVIIEGGLVLSVGICGVRPWILAAIALGVTYVSGAAAEAAETSARQAAPTAAAPRDRARSGTTFLVEGVIGIEP